MNTSQTDAAPSFLPDMSPILDAMNRLAADNLPELAQLSLTGPWAAYRQASAIQRAGLRSWAESCQQAFELADRFLEHSQQTVAAFEPHQEG